MVHDIRERLGAFTVFGFSQEPEEVLKRRLSDRLGIVPRTMDFGTAGRFFLHTASGDVAETELALVLKLGFVRSPTKAPLSARQLLEHKIATPQGIDAGALRGNALIACFDKTEARFAVYKNLLSVSQLYYWASGSELIGSDNLRWLVEVLERVELNEEMLPFHFMFRHVPGTMTYFRDVQRLFPGQLLTWREGNLDIRHVQDLRFPDLERIEKRADSQPAMIVYQELKDVVGATMDDIEASGNRVGNLLSGGVDSSVLQLTINDQRRPAPARSFSFAPVRTPSFDFEIEYARQASELLHTQHTFANFAPEDYPDLVARSVDILGQPVLSDPEPCKLALVEFLASQVEDVRFFFVASCADTVFGLGLTRKMKMLEWLGKVPGSRQALAATGTLLKPFTRRSQTLRKGAAMLAARDDPTLWVAPFNMIGVYSNLDIARRAFGDDAIGKVFEYRRNLEAQYLNTADTIERVHVVDLLSYSYEIQVQSCQLFLAYGREQVCPFMDDDVVRIGFAFPPEVRFIQGLRNKYLLKDILEQRGLSTIARRPKGGSVFTDDLFAWMRSGPLHEMVREIDRPGFVSKADFERLVETPDHFLWSLLTFDLFQKRILRR